MTVRVCYIVFGHINIYTWLKEPDQVWWLRKAEQNCSYPYVKKLFKTQFGKIPIDPAILAAVRKKIYGKNAQN